MYQLIVEGNSKTEGLTKKFDEVYHEAILNTSNLKNCIDFDRLEELKVLSSTVGKIVDSCLNYTLKNYVPIPKPENRPIWDFRRTKKH